MRVKGWLLLISMMLGLATVAGVLLWSPVDGPWRERPQMEASAVSVGPPADSQGIQFAAPTGPQAATREATSPKGAPATAPPNLDALFTALAMYRPPERLEAPDFTLPDVEGQPVRLREFQGKLVLVNFWATWCPPCRLEMPSMERLYQTFKPTDFAMLAISIDRQGAQVVKPFMEGLKLTFPALLDPTMEVARQFGLRGLPTTYLIDREGRIIGAAVGGRDWYSTEAKALIAGLLREGGSDG
jgi:peroxiredoxin